jgi:hypothetical protein
MSYYFYVLVRRVLAKTSLLMTVAVPNGSNDNGNNDDDKSNNKNKNKSFIAQKSL